MSDPSRKWLLALMRNGYPRFATISDYARPGAGTNEIIAYARSRMGGAFSWEEVKRYRDTWKGPMALKGILHPEVPRKRSHSASTASGFPTMAGARSRR